MRKAALIGRPNVGKSSLFNCLLRRRQAIVEDTPAVTRDRHYGILQLEENAFLILIDTGGFLGEKPGIEAQVAQQVRFAVEEADLLLWVVEASTGVHPMDEEFGEWLRHHRRPDQALWLVANKADNPIQMHQGLELYRLGIEPIFFVSATNGRGIESLRKALREFAQTNHTNLAVEVPRFALIGRPNVGKSTLLNTLLGKPRAIVSDIPGTTRDALEELSEWQGKPFYWIDTAGLRRKSHIPPHSIERYAALRTLEALMRADVILLVVDATEPLTAQDMSLLRQAEKQGKGIVLIFNKSDLLSEEAKRRLLIWAQKKVQPLESLPILFVSALTGKGVKEASAAAFQVYEAGHYTISTRKLNNTLLPTLRAHPHPSVGNLQPSIRFIQQIKAPPPTFLLHARHKDRISQSYLHFIRRQIRQIFPFPGWWLYFQLREAS
ncbi:MAG: ribosome biogenesis GTPase Der [Bacteroidia bacterium]|nr:ribosome biogenesis GTPase Der [Bacteroidia bacterium]MDW8133782.1 ribosome biogenesis GTPase Der [Bacteroidia bacterium]